MRAAQSVAVFARNVKKVKKSQRILSVANACQWITNLNCKNAPVNLNCRLVKRANAVLAKSQNRAGLRLVKGQAAGRSFSEALQPWILCKQVRVTRNAGRRRALLKIFEKNRRKFYQGISKPRANLCAQRFCSWENSGFLSTIRLSVTASHDWLGRQTKVITAESLENCRLFWRRCTVDVLRAPSWTRSASAPFCPGPWRPQARARINWPQTWASTSSTCLSRSTRQVRISFHEFLSVRNVVCSEADVAISTAEAVIEELEQIDGRGLLLADAEVSDQVPRAV